MMPEQAYRLSLQGWSVSLAAHAVAVTCALAFVAQVKPVLKEDVFQWEVALVRTAQPDALPQPSVAASASPASKGASAPARQMPSPPEPVAARLAPQQSVQMVHPTPEPAKPIEREIQRPRVQPMEAEAPVSQAKAEVFEERTAEAAARTNEPVQPLIEAPQPKPEPVREVAQDKQPEPAPQATPLFARSEPVHPVEAVESRSAHQDGGRRAESTPMPVFQAQEGHPASQGPGEIAPATGAPPAPSQDRTAGEAPVQVAKAAPSGQEAKADHRWLAESLWQRVAEVKRYPASARLNGLQGKVVLKAVIRSDGQLAEVSVQKSSGHSELDAAAMDAVKQACPLEMKRPLAKPEIVVSLPIVYSLAN